MAVLDEISEMLQKGKRKDVVKLCQQALDEGIPASEILSGGLLAGMDIIGRKFKANEIFVPQVLVAARAMNAGAETLKPYLADGDSTSRGKIVLGTVKGDLHDIGKNLVKMMFEGKGFEVIDLGVDVPAEKFIQTAIDNDSHIVACSALLTTTMPMLGEVVKTAEEMGVRDKLKIMVGGAPVTQEFADSVGADAYTEDATSAADKALEYV
ncbi:MAG: corrinoid protein [Lachnospiraceae bacterium]|jgi:corrinoid protein of di/trimethylamine methyltransferase|uniref:cobalamin B12-binding domain-containing protein n=1 Tax=Clostridium sp. (strain SY8519) TaxID=1042156 RepID=UPI0002171E10|nr:corrinoid protein [Clostridium sp. SY8519]MCI1653944.1 corrinoid protein [Lachnospiraceae bacterium]MCI1656147.1 corrinoid protein [Lachnospiraceae bacterium]MCI2194629.1 corrinoid protein [Lachnospiraceae bacterium]BAK47194.1 methionine synthase I, cobalamin-binding domain [Clostridium sp. SY8519]HAD19279.1 cobalamin-binding protein [Lachnospiraceae bacterium]